MPNKDVNVVLFKISFCKRNVGEIERKGGIIRCSLAPL